MCWRMAVYVLEVAAYVMEGGSVCVGGWQRMWWRVAAYVVEGGSVCDGGWQRMWLWGSANWRLKEL